MTLLLLGHLQNEGTSLFISELFEVDCAKLMKLSLWEARSVINNIVKIYHILKVPIPIGVLARILKMPVQNNNFKISARPDLATDLLQILIPTIINSLLCQKGQIALQLRNRRWFVKKVFDCYHLKVKIENSS